MNYVFHIGRRCQTLDFLKWNNFLSGFNPFSGISNSFSVAVELIKNGFEDYENYVVKFQISKINNDNDDSIEFIRCYNYSDEKLKIIKSLIKQNKFNGFFKQNYYFYRNFCINLKYTDIDNFLFEEMFFWKNNYLIYPNTDYSSEEQLDTYNRRKERFQNCLKNNKSESILLIYMENLVLDSDYENTINNAVNIYTLPYNLFYIVPIYSKTNSKNMSHEKILKINNITFYVIYFESLDYQKINNPGDDNYLGFTNEYNKIKEALLKSYTFDIVKLF